jgi:NAD(P)-dependent dehydrogenase (short-subunit alcohol dehydrogenase family)
MEHPAVTKGAFTTSTRAPDVVVVLGPGQIGQAIARRVGIGKEVLLADRDPANADAAATTLAAAGYNVHTATVDVADRETVCRVVTQALALGTVTGLVHAAGVSPSQAPPEAVLRVDLYGTALVLEEFGAVIAPGGAGIVISSQSGHRLPALTPEQNRALALTPAEDLLALPFLQPGEVVDSLHAYQLAKRGNSLRVMAQAVSWGARGARLNTISPGIVMTPLARDELEGPRGAGYRAMIEGSPVGRAGIPDEIGALAAFLMGPEGGFATGSDFLVDGGVTAAYWYGDIGEVRQSRSAEEDI